jgi:small-conductance mechanosensitive channel
MTVRLIPWHVLLGALVFALVVGVPCALAPVGFVQAQDQAQPADASPEPASDSQSGEAEGPSADATTGGDGQATIAMPELDPQISRQFSDWSDALDRFVQELARERLSLDTLVTLRDDLVVVEADIGVYVDELRPHLAEQVALLEGLTPSNGDLPDTPEISAQREQIVQLEAELRPAELLLGRARSLHEEVVSRRADEFAARLFEQSSSLVAPALWVDGLADLPDLVDSTMELSVRNWNSVRSRATPAAFAGLGVLLLALIVLAIPMRRFALRKAARKSEHEPKALEKVIGALRIVLLSAGVPAIGFAVLGVGLETVGGLSLRAETLLGTLFVNITVFFLISGLVRAILAPGLRQWRLVPIADGYAGRASILIRWAALAYVVGEIARSTASVFVSPLAVVQLVEAAPVLIAALSVLAAMRLVLRGLESADGSQPPSMIEIVWRWTIPVAALVSLVAIVAQLFGFLALAAFLIDRLVWTAVVLAALYLATMLVEKVSTATLQQDTGTSLWVHEHIGLSPTALGQFGVLLSGAIKLVLIVAAGSLIIAPFGVETGALSDVLTGVFTGFQIGGFSFSLTSVLLAIVLIFIGVIVTRSVQGWLENRYLPRTSLDTGLKASIRTGVGYVGIIVSCMLGLSYLGLNLENIALVAGALSVGIGFGLQSIVSNFVSGLILLAERPFKAGDWIVVGDEQGIVKRINVRATEIQTFDRATVLVPNSEFISGAVKNRVHRDTLGRIDIPVGVGYDSDPEQVREILLDVANNHPQTLSYPEPSAFFIEFGASSLDFMLFAYLADVNNGYGVRSDIRFEIFKRFKEAGIEIPFAQSDVTIRNLDHVLDALAAAGKPIPEGLGAGSPTGQAGVSTVPAPAPKATPISKPDRTVDTAPDDSPDEGPVTPSGQQS